MTLDELSRMADECASDYFNGRRMAGGRYAQRAVRYLRKGQTNEAKREIVDAALHWPDDFAQALGMDEFGIDHE